MSNHTEDEFDAGALADMLADELKGMSVGPDGSVTIHHVADESPVKWGVIDAGSGGWRVHSSVEESGPDGGGMPGGDAVAADVEGMPGGDAVVAAPSSGRVRVLPAWDKGTVSATVAARACIHIGDAHRRHRWVAPVPARCARGKAVNGRARPGPRARAGCVPCIAWPACLIMAR